MTLHELYQTIKQQLKEGGIEPYASEARFLMEGVLGVDYQNILVCGEMEATPEQLNKARSAVCRRLEGYPLQYLLGTWEFYSYPFEVGEGVLIPRPDTETLCEQGLAYLTHWQMTHGKERPVVVDLCSGSGCLAVSVACEYEGARVYAVEKYDAALSYLRRNVKLNQADVKIVQGDVLINTYAEPIPEADLVLCNPPYLTEEDMKHLQKEVTFEPASALYGEAEDGLTFYRVVSSGWRERIRSGGMLAFEIGMGQEQAVKQILQKEGYQNICTVLDACGIIRVLTAVRP